MTIFGYAGIALMVICFVLGSIASAWYWLTAIVWLPLILVTGYVEYRRSNLNTRR